MKRKPSHEMFAPEQPNNKPTLKRIKSPPLRRPPKK